MSRQQPPQPAAKALDPVIPKEYWMSDRSCTTCYECNRHFTLLVRRHHCRLCGRIFCNGCCPKTSVAQAVGPPVKMRACSHCLATQSREASSEKTDGATPRLAPAGAEEDKDATGGAPASAATPISKSLSHRNLVSGTDPGEDATFSRTLEQGTPQLGPTDASERLRSASPTGPYEHSFVHRVLNDTEVDVLSVLHNAAFTHLFGITRQQLLRGGVKASLYGIPSSKSTESSKRKQ